jgi:sulfatase maturation enzyme AslB (radical SAM superfamily)
MEIKIENQEGLLDKSIREIIFAKAVEQLVKELTPERLKEFAVKWFEDSMRYVNFYDAKKPLQAHVDTYLKQYSMRPENIALIEEACRQGFEKIIAELPGEIYESHKDRILEAFKPRSR